MRTETASTIADVRRRVSHARRTGRTIGCVPTMGALHAGHGALIERARASADFVVVTIFVNPTQFDRAEDYQHYSRNLIADRAFCEARRVDLIFAPDAAEIYPAPLDTSVEVWETTRRLCGEFRLGHFRGVTTVVAKLFNIVQPDLACFGEKDAQQLAAIMRMVRDLDFPITIVPVPTVRETDGLALSSRNARLKPADRAIAPVLFRALSAGQRLITGGETDPAIVAAGIQRVLEGYRQIEVEYVEVVDERMQPVGRIEADVRVAAAIWIGGVRLIDNLLCRVTSARHLC